MRKTDKPITPRILKTEISHALQMMEEGNYGYAKQVLYQVLNRVEKYHLKQEREEVPK